VIVDSEGRNAADILCGGRAPLLAQPVPGDQLKTACRNGSNVAHMLPPNGRELMAKQLTVSETETSFVNMGLWSLVRDPVNSWLDDNAARLAAALAYYTLLSLAPLLVIAIALAGLFFGEEAARGHIALEVGSVVGVKAGQAIEAIVASARTPGSGIISTAVGIMVLLFGASGAFGELQTALNTIRRVKPKPGRGLRGLIAERFFSLLLVSGVAFFLLVSLVVSAALAALGRFFETALPGGEVLWQIVMLLLSLGVTTLCFAFIFKVVPEVEIAWKDVWAGASATALLFTLGKTLLALYIGKSGSTSAFGAAGSMVALVIWVYYSSQVLFLGAEFTRVFAHRRGARIQPSRNAVTTEKGDPMATPISDET